MPAPPYLLQPPSHTRRNRPHLRLDTSSSADDWALGRAHRVPSATLALRADLATSTSTSTNAQLSKETRLHQRQRQRRHRNESSAEGVRRKCESEWDVDLEAGRSASPRLPLQSPSNWTESWSATLPSLESGYGYDGALRRGEEDELEGMGERNPFLRDPKHPARPWRGRHVPRSRGGGVYPWSRRLVDKACVRLRRGEDYVADAIWALQTVVLRWADDIAEWAVERMMKAFDTEKGPCHKGEANETNAFDDDDPEEGVDFDDVVASPAELGESKTVSGPGWGWIGRWTVLERLYLKGMQESDRRLRPNSV